jgi:bifunctional UDP-N-acetylglucosamine pyrophosphorylase/glucosamine-1-phosphate N-acetyltransferase
MKITVVMPAAGKGSRLKSQGPKILHEIKGEPILSRILAALPREVDQIIVVARTEHSVQIMKTYLKYNNVPDRNLEICTQNTPTGTADAIKIGLSQTKTSHALIIWGDQVGVTSDIMLDITKFAGNHPENDMVFPVVLMDKPYVSFKLSLFGQIRKFNESKMTGFRAKKGYSDCGLFLVKVDKTKLFLNQCKNEIKDYTTKFGECNFLSLFVLAKKNSYKIKAFKVHDKKLTVGINTLEDINHFLESHYEKG